MTADRCRWCRMERLLDAGFTEAQANALVDAGYDVLDWLTLTSLHVHRVAS